MTVLFICKFQKDPMLFDIMDRSYGRKSFPFRTNPCEERIDK